MVLGLQSGNYTAAGENMPAKLDTGSTAYPAKAGLQNKKTSLTIISRLKNLI